jgi:hypothetical protein
MKARKVSLAISAMTKNKDGSLKMHFFRKRLKLAGIREKDAVVHYEVVIVRG